jgi:L-ribulose-5-phosphate 4-epimerase
MKPVYILWRMIDVLDELKLQVFEANLLLPKHNLITFTWGNVSGIDRSRKYIVIKPSGVEYEEMAVDDMVVLDIDGNVVEGELRPSSDTPTHLELYRNFDNIWGIAHTHSKWATIMAQSKMDIPALGTTHGDYFYGDIPCTREMTREEINGEYELETGKVIIETLHKRRINPMKIPAVLVANHGPFVFGNSPEEAVRNSVILEEIAFMAWHGIAIAKDERMQQDLLDRHYLRKHGKDSYYGQISG